MKSPRSGPGSLEAEAAAPAGGAGRVQITSQQTAPEQMGEGVHFRFHLQYLQTRDKRSNHILDLTNKSLRSTSLPRKTNDCSLRKSNKIG